MKRLLAIMLAFIFVIMAFASCSKMGDVENASDTGDSSDSDSYSDNAINSNGMQNSGDESNQSTDNSVNETENNSNNNNNSNDASKETEAGTSNNQTQEKPTFNVKESTSGLKFALNEDGRSYTLVNKGTCTATSIVIDGHNGLPVTVIGYSAFGDDSKITSVKLGDYVEIIEDQAFSMCKALTSFTFGKGVKFLGDYSFRYCTALTSIELGKNVETIKYGAFYKSSKLATIKMYDKVRIIEEYAFDGTAYFSNDSNWKNKVLYIGTNLVKAKSDISGSYTVTTGTTCIGGLAFYGCASISGITIPNSVHSIGLKAFANTTALKNINIGTGITYIGEKSFTNCGYYKDSGKWSGNILYVGDYLVATKSAVSGSVTIKSGVKVISDLAFNACESITSVTVPDSVVYIGEYAFRGCTKLVNITIGTGLKEIGIYAFKDCSSLKGITIRKTSGWKAGDVEISSSMLATKEETVNYLAMVYSNKVWKRS